MHQKAGLRNLILEKKLETIQETIDAKEASIS
jgi:chromosome segregation ATPase